METNGIDITPRIGYSALSSQLAIVKPTPTKIEDYSPSNSALPCQDITLRGDLDSYSEDLHGEMKISTILPAKPNRRVCSCMMDNINCIANPMASLEETFISRKNLCDHDESLCFGTTFNSTEGRYGSFLMCNLTETASWIQQQNYIAHNNDSAACSSAEGAIQQATPSASLASDCQVLLRQAGSDGRGTITFTPSSESSSLHVFSPGKGELHTGAKIVIGVSIAGFAILCVVLGVYFWALRLSKKGTTSSDDDHRKPRASRHKYPTD